MANQWKQMKAMVWLLTITCLLISISAKAEEISNDEPNGRLQIPSENAGEKSGWRDRLHFGGAIEADVGYVVEEVNNDETATSGVTLSTVELGLDATIAKHVFGHVVLLYEQGEADGAVLVDEGYISLNGEDVVPLYLNAGKFYVPFGNYTTFMLSDPLTLEMGETGQTALLAGFTNGWINAGVAVFNGDVDDSGEHNDHFDTYVLAVAASIPDNIISNVKLSGGLSYISSISDTDGMEEVFDDADITLGEDNVAGLSCWFSAAVMDMFFLEAEYITAMTAFEAEDLNLAENRRFGAWNLELAYAPIEKVTIAARYAQTLDAEGFFPESQYGAAVSYNLIKSTTLGFEYLKNQYEDDADTLITARLAIGF